MASRGMTNRLVSMAQGLLAMAVCFLIVSPAVAQHRLGVPLSPGAQGSHFGDRHVSDAEFLAILAGEKPAGAQPDGLERLPENGAEELASPEPATEAERVIQYAANEAHANCYKNDPFPSAKTCGKCHPKHFREWSVSPHAYAQLSPVFNAFQNAENQLLHGTLGDFCIRCHTPVGMALQEPRGGSNLNRHPTSREGITCVVCHRINQPNGRISGRFSLVAGGNHQVVYGTLGNRIIEDAIANPDQYGVLKKHRDDSVRGQELHSGSYKFFQLSTSGFCTACHDVLFPLGFRLEDAASEYKSSPAARIHGLSCQDCHMGKVQGRACGYDYEPVAKVGNAETPARKRTSHFFAGPDHSIIHPGIFPHNPEAVREENDPPGQGGLATMRQWLEFDWRAGWGTHKFEKKLADDKKEREEAKEKDKEDSDHHESSEIEHEFPEFWKDVAKRYRARDILNDQFELLTVYREKRVEVLREGIGMSGVEGMRCDEDGLHFKVKVFNRTTGHGVPTGFDGERPFYLQVVVWDREDQVVFRSGDLDPNGDYRDDHSFFVHNGKVPRDRQLFSLQSKFITRNIRGGEREQILPIPYSLNPLNFDRPALRPFTPLGRPLGARKHKQNIEPLGHRWAKYHVDTCRLTGKGPYRVNVRFIAGMIPVNLVKTIEFVGFDYGMSSQEVGEAIVRGHILVREASAVFKVHCK